MGCEAEALLAGRPFLSVLTGDTSRNLVSFSGEARALFGALERADPAEWLRVV